ncbi:MAG: symmetrical bis(5'-nucleosyl)-tetraphosphatase [Pseudomonadota bacterium]
MALYAVGDVQGCYDALRRLLDRLDFDDQRDRLWFCGDLVGRGPRALRVLRFVKSLGDAAVTVLGNHDVNLIDCARTGRKPRAADRLARVLASRDCDDLIDWLATRPFAHEDRGRRAVLVHAGVPPGWTRRQLMRRASKLARSWQDEFIGDLRTPCALTWKTSLNGLQKRRFTLNALTRMRYCDANGALNFSAKGPPDAYDNSVQPWYRFLHDDWRDRQIYFGHWSALGDADSLQVTSLDTGCVWGRSLTAVKVPKKPRRQIEYDCVSCAKRR